MNTLGRATALPFFAAIALISHNQGMDKISVYKAPSEFLALTIKDMLDENGIPCMIRTDQVAGYNFTPRGYFGDILVYSEDEDKARELIGGFQGTLGELAEHETSDEDVK